MLRSAFFFIFFLVFCRNALPQDLSQNKCIFNTSCLEFWNNVRILPVRFLEKNNDENGNIRLSGVFASNLILERVNFVLPVNQEQEKKETFFEQGREWEEQIDRKTFLKKYKKDFWLITYFKTEIDNIIINGHQFKQWQAIKLSFASHPDQLRRSVDRPDFWQDLRLRIVFFYAFNNDKAYWISSNQIDKTEPFSESDYEFVPLANGQITTKRITAHQLFDLRILDQGVFYIQKNTIFHKQELESSKARKVLKFTLTDARIRLRSLFIDRDYFLQNFQKHFWFCFYDSKFQSLARVVETLDKPADEPLEEKILKN